MTVFVLGAGASLSAGYPLGAELGPRLLSWLRSQALEFTEDREVLQSLDGEYGTGYAPNFEEVLERMSSSLAGSLKGCVMEYFRYLRGIDKSSTYLDFADRLVQSGDIVVTLNYDLAVETALRATTRWEPSDGYGFWHQEGTPSPVKVLKPHGSVNWIARNSPSSAAGVMSAGRWPKWPPVFFNDEALGIRCPYPEISGPLPQILPTTRKEYGVEPEEIDFWNFLFQQSGDALAAAEKVVVIGYSFTELDARPRSLLSRVNPNAVVEIYCRSRSLPIAELFSSAGCRHVSADDKASFEDYVKRDGIKSGHGPSAIDRGRA